MNDRPVFRGVAAALATPFTKDGIDWAALGAHIEFLLTHGTDALVACGTTGEAAVLSETEHIQTVDFCVRKANGRVPVIAGTGSNDIKKAARLTERACLCGADAVMAVTPYYNKTTEKGLFESYKAIAGSSDKPVIVYNVPSRTGVNVTPEQYALLAEIPGIRAVKEADPDINKLARTASLCRGKLDIYCGNDALFLPFLSLGASGIVSVAANVIPRGMKTLYTAFRSGRIRRAWEKQDILTPLEEALFCETNPVPVKTLLSYMGFCEPRFRLPLTAISERNGERLIAAYEAAKDDIQ